MSYSLNGPWGGPAAALACSPELEFEVTISQLGTAALGVWGPRGPGICAFDICVDSGLAFVAAGTTLSAFRVDELRSQSDQQSHHPSGSSNTSRVDVPVAAPLLGGESPEDMTAIHEESGGTPELATPCWTLTLPSIINRVRCGSILDTIATARGAGLSDTYLPVCTAVCDDGTIALLVTSDLPLTEEDRSPLRLLQWRHGSSSWGLAISRGADTSNQVKGRSCVVVSANDHCLSVYQPAFDDQTLNSSFSDSPVVVHTGVGGTSSYSYWPQRRSPLSQPRFVESKLVMRGHTGNLPCVDVTPDGCRAASASLDEHICTWDLVTGSLEKKLYCKEISWAILHIYLQIPPLFSHNRSALASLPNYINTTRAHVARVDVRSVFTDLLKLATIVMRRGQARLLLRRLNIFSYCRRSATQQAEERLSGQLGTNVDLTHPIEEMGPHEPEARLAGSAPPVDLVCSHVLPFVQTPALIDILAKASRGLRQASQAELNETRRHELFLLHISETKICIRSPNSLAVLAELRLPFSGAFTHMSCCPELGLVLVSSSAHDRGRVWVLYVERTLTAPRLTELCVMNIERNARVLGHAVVRSNSCQPSVAAGSFRFHVLLSTGRLLCYKLLAVREP